jgi:hypothetical protein
MSLCLYDQSPSLLGYFLSILNRLSSLLITLAMPLESLGHAQQLTATADPYL